MKIYPSLKKTPVPKIQGPTQKEETFKSTY
jgi:hypothetical protein